MSDSEAFTNRLTELESTVAFLQHDLEQMHSVVIQQHQTIDDLQRQLSRLAEKITPTQDDLPDPLQERPPHY